MNYKINVTGGGIFSKYMLCIQNLANLNFDNCYINIVDNRTNEDMFSCVFDQIYDNDYININANFIPSYSNIKKIELSNNFLKYKKIIDKFPLKQNILNKIEYYQKNLNITDKTIGVHIRLTDMNIYHSSDYGYFNFNQYLKYFNEHDDFFVASDNEESLKKLTSMFKGNIKFIPNLFRGNTEFEDTSKLQLNNFKNPLFWEEAFIEMIILSKCGSLISSASNLSNFSIIYSDTIKNITRI